MNRPRPLVAGVDGSPESLAAADWAAREAVRRDVPLRLVHAWLWQPLDLPVTQDRESAARRAQEVLKAAETDLADRFPQLELTADVLRDATVPALLRAGREAGMLVIGSRGHGAVLGFLLGSYGRQVIAAAECPVVSVREAKGAPAPGPGEGEVVVGQQGGVAESGDVLRFAFEAAAARHTTLRAVRAWSLPPVYAYSPGSLWLADRFGGLEPYEKAALEQALEPWRQKYPEVEVVEHVEMGSGAEVLLSAASRAELLVVGRQVRQSPVGPRTGSVAHAALHHARCPVAVVPHV
ncbi:universal stress protein [Streptomyces racemochromogenes]|uniref:Universal stress protein n=1 Tax=Streptomyces racemochromogenes TaxID=67353 RepID=A0ABW7PEJ5_9ACTN